MCLHDYKLDVETHQGLLSCIDLYAGMVHASGYSDIGLARNKIFNMFAQSEYEWLVCVDNDIGFTREDFELLLMPLKHQGFEEVGQLPALACNAPYSKKNEEGDAVTNGLGFSCINRHVLHAIMRHCPFVYKDSYTGQMMQDFCITGAAPNFNLLREDTGFWFLVREMGVEVYLQKETKLRHYGGRHCYELSSIFSTLS